MISLFLVLLVSIVFVVPLSFAESHSPTSNCDDFDDIDPKNITMRNEFYGFGINTIHGTFCYTFDGGVTWTLIENFTFLNNELSQSIIYIQDIVVWKLTSDLDSQITIEYMGTGKNGTEIRHVVYSTTLILDGKNYLECGIDVKEKTLMFNELDIGVESSEKIISISNIGNQTVAISIFGADWLDDNSNAVMNYSQTRVSTVSGEYGEKNLLGSDVDNTTSLFTLESGFTNLTYWQVLPILNADSKSFSGSLTQTLTFVSDCE